MILELIPRSAYREETRRVKENVTNVGRILQGGGVKQMGVLKPWAPSRSYGLVVKLDAAFAPVKSLHSRADGSRHGTTSALEHEGTLFVASKGGDAVLAIPAMELVDA